MNEKIITLEKKIWNLIDKYKFEIFLAIISLISLYARYLMLGFQSDDYISCLEPWFNELKANGGIFGLKLEIGNYNAPYMFILALLTYLPIEPIVSIKFVSIIFDYICAHAIMKIMYIIFKKNKHKELYAVIAYSLALFIPSVLLNSACWGQADSIYTAFILLSIVCLFEKKYLKAFIFLGISFAFKLQCIFILPLYILIYISDRKFPLYYFLILPLANIAMCIPSILCGKSISSCLQVYANQASEYKEWLSMNFANVYNLILPTNESNFAITSNEFIEKVGIMVTIAVFGIMALWVLYKKVKFNKQKIIEFGLWSIMTATFFLPHMHDRYLYVGELLGILYFVYNRNKIYVPVGLIVISLYEYSKFLFGQDVIPIQYMSILFLVLLVIVTKDIIKKYLLEDIPKDKENTLEI